MKTNFDLDIDLEDFEINKKERAISKTHYIPFSRYSYWILKRNADGENMFYARELCKFAKISYTTSYRYFQDLLDLGYVVARWTGGFVYYSLVMEGSKPKLLELLPYIKKTLKKLQQND